MRKAIEPPVELHEIAGHINSAEFVAKSLEIFDRWVAEGLIPPGVRGGTAR